MKRVSSEELAPACAPAASRIIAAEHLGEVAPVALAELAELAGQPRPARPLRARDLDTEVGRAAYAMGRRRGYADGLAAGRAQGFREGSQALQEFGSRKAAEVAVPLQQLVEGFRAELAALEGQLAEDLVTLAVAIARQVLRRELATDRAALLPAAAEALRALGENAGRIELHVHPNDAQALREHLQAHAGVAGWQLVEDPGLRRGGCRIEAVSGLADASVQARWQAVMDALGRPGEAAP